MSIRAEALTLYALTEPSDGTTDCPVCIGRDCPSGVAIVVGDLVRQRLAGEYVFRCLCCSYTFEGAEI